MASRLIGAKQLPEPLLAWLNWTIRKFKLLSKYALEVVVCKKSAILFWLHRINYPMTFAEWNTVSVNQSKPFSGWVFIISGYRVMCFSSTIFNSTFANGHFFHFTQTVSTSCMKSILNVVTILTKFLTHNTQKKTNINRATFGMKPNIRVCHFFISQICI